MWQRLQTLYLIISTALIASLFFSNLATIIGPEGEQIKIAYHEKLIYLLFLLMLLSANISAIFTYKNRLLQMRVAVLAAIITLGFQIWLAVDIIVKLQIFAPNNPTSFSITAVFPLVAVILNFLAARNIMSDEYMVRASSSLRAADRRRNKSTKK